MKYCISMEAIIVLSVVSLILFGVVVFQQVLIFKMHTEGMDAMNQKSAGIYYPKDLRKQDLLEEKDKSDFADINDISDEEFKKAVGLGKDGKDGQ